MITHGKKGSQTHILAQLVLPHIPIAIGTDPTHYQKS